MKLNELSAEPKLIKLTIDDENTVKQYGESIDFWVYDRQPMRVFMQLATLDKENFGELAELVVNLILDEKGKPMLKAGAEPPANVMMHAITKIVGELGNLNSQTLEK